MPCKSRFSTLQRWLCVPAAPLRHGKPSPARHRRTRTGRRSCQWRCNRLLHRGTAWRRRMALPLRLFLEIVRLHNLPRCVFAVLSSVSVASRDLEASMNISSRMPIKSSFSSMCWNISSVTLRLMPLFRAMKAP